MYLMEIWFEGVGWIHMSKDKNWWWTPAKNVTNIRVIWRWRISWLAERLSASQGRPCSMELVHINVTQISALHQKN
jgi:hypothetical protein